MKMLTGGGTAGLSSRAVLDGVSWFVLCWACWTRKQQTETHDVNESHITKLMSSHRQNRNVSTYCQLTQCAITSPNACDVSSHYQIQLLCHHITQFMKCVIISPNSRDVMSPNHSMCHSVTKFIWCIITLPNSCDVSPCHPVHAMCQHINKFMRFAIISPNSHRVIISPTHSICHNITKIVWFFITSPNSCDMSSHHQNHAMCRHIAKFTRCAIISPNSCHVSKPTVDKRVSFLT